MTAERKQVLSHGGLGTRGVLDNTSTMRELEEMRRVTRVYRLEGNHWHSYSLIADDSKVHQPQNMIRDHPKVGTV